jgi:uncharacterized protein (TIGR01777 family)
MNILLTGGTGFIGSELCPMLLRDGHYLNILTRNPEKHGEQQAKNLKFISWNTPLIAVMEWADAVINLAGESIFGRRWNEQVKKKIYHSRIDNTKKLVDAIKEADYPPQVMISGSAAGYYGGAGVHVLREEDPPGDDFLANVCVVWEKAAAPAQDAGVRLVLARLGIVLEKEGGMLQQLLPFFRFFVGGPIGRGTQFVPWIHRRDLCRSFIYLLENEQLEGPFNVNAPNPVTMEELAEAIGDVMNRPSVLRVPEFVLKKVLGDAAEPALASLRMQPEHLLESGFELRFNDIREALSDIL